MFSLSKKTEYGLLALTYLSSLQAGQLANVSEIAESSDIPKELLAKILSELVKAGITNSHSGPTGGFRLARPAAQVSLAEIIRVLESKSSIIHCVGNSDRCDRTETCEIRGPMKVVKQQVDNIFEQTSLSDITASRKPSEKIV